MSKNVLFFKNNNKNFSSISLIFCSSSFLKNLLCSTQHARIEAVVSPTEVLFHPKCILHGKRLLSKNCALQHSTTLWFGHICVHHYQNTEMLFLPETLHRAILKTAIAYQLHLHHQTPIETFLSSPIFTLLDDTTCWPFLPFRFPILGSVRPSHGVRRKFHSQYSQRISHISKN